MRKPRPRAAAAANEHTFAVPVVSSDCTRSEFLRAYRRTQCVLIRHAARTSPGAASATLEVLRTAHAAEPRILDATFTLENGGPRRSAEPRGKKRGASSSVPGEVPADARGVLAAALEPSGLAADARWYASFILQGAPTSVTSALHAALPCAVPRVLSAEAGAADPAQPTWWFIGSNCGPDPLAGRPEHTDALSHDGTWHFQLSGRKLWRVRPTDELLQDCKARGGAAVGPVEVLCLPGDLLAINTRLWWHSTELPASHGRTRVGGGSQRLSVSYARDFVLAGPGPAAAGQAAAAGSSARAGADELTNVDGLFATQRIRKGTIIMRADEMPDCELPESASPNCEVCEEEHSGELVLVASRNIASGEFFCVPVDSSDDESSDESEDYSVCKPCRP